MITCRVRSGSTCVELTEGATMPRMLRTTSSLIVDGVIQGDPESGFVVEFIYHGIHWTVSTEDVETINMEEVR